MLQYVAVVNAVHEYMHVKTLHSNGDIIYFILKFGTQCSGKMPLLLMLEYDAWNCNGGWNCDGIMEA